MKLANYALALLALSTYASAYIRPIQYHETQVKIYNDAEEDCIKMMDMIPEKYYEGVSTMKIFNKENTLHLGFYWYYNSIELFDGCLSPSTLIHELAHHCQAIKGDSLYLALSHEGWFGKCEAEIGKSLIYN